MPAPVRVAVDALGGDRGPDEVVAGALAARSKTIEPVLYGPAGFDSQGLAFVETTQEIAMHEKPADAVRGKPDSSLVAACRAVARGSGRRGDLGGEHRRNARGLSRLHSAPSGSAPTGDRRHRPDAAVDRRSSSTPAPTPTAVRSTCAVRRDGRDLRRGDPRRRRGPRSACSRSVRSRRRETSSRCRRTSCWPRATLNFIGNVESRWLLAHAADVVVCDGFTGNVCAEAPRRARSGRRSTGYVGRSPPRPVASSAGC